MTGKPTDAQIDQLLRAQWLEIGLAQADLAELLDAALQPTPKDGDGPAGMDAGRLTRLAKALGIPAGFPVASGGTDRKAEDRKVEDRKVESWPAEDPGSQQSLLQLRLLRAFCELSDHRAQRMLVYLAEQLAKCAATRPGDAG
jgi:hypothetical protein